MKQYLEESMAIPEKIYETNGAEETFEVGMRLAKEAKAGDIYCLDGDLGTGKTVFSQGFAAGLGIKEAVNSPTFTIVCEYEEGRLPLYRFDEELNMVCVMEPKLLLVEELAQNLKELKSDDENVLFTGDGMHVHGAWLKENVSKSKMAPAVCSTPRAAAVAELGAKKWREGKAINADDHRPIYLKKSQAEQEREAGIYTKGSLRPGESGTQAKIC